MIDYYNDTCGSELFFPLIPIPKDMMSGSNYLPSAFWPFIIRSRFCTEGCSRYIPKLEFASHFKKYKELLIETEDAVRRDNDINNNNNNATLTYIPKWLWCFQCMSVSCLSCARQNGRHNLCYNGWYKCNNCKQNINATQHTPPYNICIITLKVIPQFIRYKYIIIFI